MDNCDIKIDKEGIWYYRGAHMFRKEILCIFFKSLRIDESGKYLIELGDECCYLDVEDTAFVVEAVSKNCSSRGDEDRLDILLTDDSLEELDLSTIRIGNDNVMYCKVKNGKFDARFSRKSYYQLAEFIEEEDNKGTFFVNVNGKKHYINRAVA